MVRPHPTWYLEEVELSNGQIGGLDTPNLAFGGGRTIPPNQTPPNVIQPPSTRRSMMKEVTKYELNGGREVVEEQREAAMNKESSTNCEKVFYGHQPKVVLNDKPSWKVIFCPAQYLSFINVI
jgi:hypothetical protein